MEIEDNVNQFKKFLLKRSRTLLTEMDIKKDFLEISTNHMGTMYQARIHGVEDANGTYTWSVIRVINQTIIPAAYHQ
jgi:hypothetical protein